MQDKSQFYHPLYNFQLARNLVDIQQLANNTIYRYIDSFLLFWKREDNFYHYKKSSVLVIQQALTILHTTDLNYLL